MRNLYVGMAAAALMTTGAVAQSPTPSPGKFVMEAGASDLFEIDSAKLMGASKDPKVASFASTMMLAHAKSTKMVKTAARSDGLMPKPPKLTIKQRTDLTALKAVPAGKTRDDLYVKQQKAAHADALALMQDYAANGTASHLRAGAGKIAPVVESHIAMLGTM